MCQAIRGSPDRDGNLGREPAIGREDIEVARRTAGPGARAGKTHDIDADSGPVRNRRADPGGPDHLLYHGYRVDSGAPVVIKIPRSSPQTPRDLAMLQHEYALLRELDVPGVVKALALEKHGTSLALVLEAIPGRTLSALLAEQRLEPAAALRIAVAIAGILEGVHAQGVVHKDIKPSNIVVHRDTSQANLIDFGLATRLSRETQRPVSPDALEGTLSYLSPEQTGRMNRSIDRRTDFYSLGVTLYQMLTGALPSPARIRSSSCTATSRASPRPRATWTPPSRAPSPTS